MYKFENGFRFFTEHASDFAGVELGNAYVDTVHGEIGEFLSSLEAFNLRSREIIPRFWYKTLMVATASH